MGTFGAGVFGGTGGGDGGATGPIGTVPASKLFYAAMRKAGITLAPGRTPSSDQYQDALDECNRMIGGWNCERPKIFTIRIDQLPLTTAKTYTIGIDPSAAFTADWNVPRPQEIIRANVIFPPTSGGGGSIDGTLFDSAPGNFDDRSGNFDDDTVTTTDSAAFSGFGLRRPVRILDDEQFAAISLQDIASGIPYQMYNDGAYPFSNISVVPQTVSGYFLELYTWQAIPKFVAVTDFVTLPDGYEDAIVFNLAVRLAPHFQKGEASPSIQRQAQRALGAIASKNLPGAPKISADAPGKGRGGFSYLVGM